MLNFGLVFSKPLVKVDLAFTLSQIREINRSTIKLNCDLESRIEFFIPFAASNRPHFCITGVVSRDVTCYFE